MQGLGAPVSAEQLVPLLEHIAGDEGGDDDDGPEHHEEELAIIAAQIGALKGQAEGLCHLVWVRVRARARARVRPKFTVRSRVRG